MDLKEFPQFWVTAKPPKFVEIGQLSPVYGRVLEGAIIHLSSPEVATIQQSEGEEAALLMMEEKQVAQMMKPNQEKHVQDLYYVHIKENEFLAVVESDAQIQIDEGRWVHEKLRGKRLRVLERKGIAAQRQNLNTDDNDPWVKALLKVRYNLTKHL